MLYSCSYMTTVNIKGLQTELSAGVEAPDVDFFGQVRSSDCSAVAGPDVAELQLLIELNATRRQSPL